MDSEKLARTFVDLADSLVEDFDALDLLNLLVERCVDLLGVSAAGLMLADARDELRLAVSTAESARLMDLYQLQNDEGPCLECFRTGQQVLADDLASAGSRWPRFAQAALAEGFDVAAAIPLRLRGRVIGALNLFDTAQGGLRDASVFPIAQAMADVATIAIIQERLGKQRDVLNEQLQTALNNRVLIEQAKGVLAARMDIGTNEAFERMRKWSRDDRRRLVDVARDVVHGRSDHHPAT